MNSPTVSDLALLVPELILVVMALALILAARRIQRAPVAVVGTVLAALAAVVASGWVLSLGPKTGFGGMIILDGYSHFFKVLIAATLALTALLSVSSIDGEKVPRAEYHALLLLASTGMMLAVSALDLLTLYLSLELITLCSYILVGISVKRPTPNEAARIATIPMTTSCPSSRTGSKRARIRTANAETVVSTETTIARPV